MRSLFQAVAVLASSSFVFAMPGKVATDQGPGISDPLSHLGGGGGEDEKKSKAKASSTNEDTNLPEIKPEKWYKYSLERGLTIELGEDNKVTVRNAIQPMYKFAEWGRADTDPTNKFDLRRVRTRIDGTANGDRFAFRVQNDWTESNSIKDAWFQWNVSITDDYKLSIRGGQQKVHFGREANIDDTKLDFIYRSAVSQTFSNARSRGIQVMGSAVDDQLRYSLGAFNTDVAMYSIFSGEDSMNADNKLDWTGFVEWTSHPGKVGMSATEAGDLAVAKDVQWAAGAGLYHGNYKDNIVDRIRATTLWTFAEVRYGGINGNFEGFWRRDESDLGPDIDSRGLTAGATWVCPGEEKDCCRWGAGLRVSYVNLMDMPLALTGTRLNVPPSRAGKIFQIEAVGNLFQSHNHRFKHQAGFVYQNVDPENGRHEDDYIFLLQTTFHF